MDVQMPIIDGYRATHLIRHHAPYNTIARNTPIVAMTASAIQGDREKCKKAGMDDYLAKPVKGKTLEKMLVRWALSRRVPRTADGRDSEGSECSEPGEHNCGTAAIPVFGLGKFSTSAVIQDSPSIKTSRLSMNERQNSHHLTLPGPESEGDRVERREEAEEKATMLRDEKLVEAASAHGERLVPPGEGRPPGQKLTVENVGKLEREVEKIGGVRTPRSEFQQRTLSAGINYVGEDQVDGVEKTEKCRSGERPRMERRWMDSESTVTGRE
jgi:CheY-like chemotaxis protein